MKLVVLASGRGSRLNNLTKHLPKCMVKLNGFPIIRYLSSSFKLFKEVIVVTGYRSSKIEKELGSSVRYIKNSNYKNTNMVYSLFCASQLINEDIIVTYSDIVVDPLIFKRLLKTKDSTIPLNYNWLKIWKKRMSLKEIYEDAEDVKIKNNRLIEIGTKITKKKLPKMQYMGIIKINKYDFKKLKNFFLKLNKPRTDFTSFLNESVKANIIEIKCMKSKLLWAEIDSIKDLKASRKLLKNIKL